MSGYVADELLRRDLAHDDVLFLHKPFEMDALTDVVQRALDGRAR